MAMNIGHYSIDDLLAVREQTVLEYGMNNVQAVLERDLADWNREVASALEYLSMDTTARADRFGVSVDADMYEADEYDRGVGGREAGGSDVNYPLRKFKRNVGWTLDYMKVATPRDMAEVQISVRQGNRRAIHGQIQRAIYRPANYAIRDKLVDNYTLNVKRLLNADGDPIPNGPYNLSFDGSTHTHYLANATLTDAALQAAIDTVTEHNNESNVQIIVAETNLTSVSALTNYLPAKGELIVVGEDQDRVNFAVTQRDTANQRVGVYNGLYEVWTKPWALANYALVIDRNGPKPLKRRIRPQMALRGLRMSSVSQLEPLRVEFFEDEFGFGVHGRSSAAVLQFNNATYQDPF